MLPRAYSSDTDTLFSAPRRSNASTSPMSLPRTSPLFPPAGHMASSIGAAVEAVRISIYKLKAQQIIFALLGIQSLALITLLTRQASPAPYQTEPDAFVGRSRLSEAAGQHWSHGKGLRSNLGARDRILIGDDSALDDLTAKAVQRGDARWTNAGVKSLLSEMADVDEEDDNMENEELDIAAKHFMNERWMQTGRRKRGDGKPKKLPRPDEDLLGEMEDGGMPTRPVRTRRARRARSEEPKQVRGVHLELPSEIADLPEDQAQTYRLQHERERQVRLREVRSMYFQHRNQGLGVEENAAEAWQQKQQAFIDVANVKDAVLFQVHKSAVQSEGTSTHTRLEGRKETVVLGEDADFVEEQRRSFPGGVVSVPPQCAHELDTERTWHVITTGFTRAAATWQFLVVRRILELGGILKRGESVAAAQGGKDQALAAFHSSRVAVASVEAFHPDLLSAADYIFTSHRDIRNEFASQYRHHGAASNGGIQGGGPQLHVAFHEYGNWVPHACLDMKYEDILADEATEIKKLAALLCLPHVDAAQVSADVKAMIGAARHKSQQTKENSLPPPAEENSHSSAFPQEPPVMDAESHSTEISSQKGGITSGSETQQEENPAHHLMEKEENAQQDSNDQSAKKMWGVSGGGDDATGGRHGLEQPSDVVRRSEMEGHSEGLERRGGESEEMRFAHEGELLGLGGSDARAGEMVRGDAQWNRLAESAHVRRKLMQARHSYDLYFLPPMTVENIDQSFGRWLQRHGYFVQHPNHGPSSAIAAHANSDELFKPDVLRLQNCPIPRS